MPWHKCAQINAVAAANVGLVGSPDTFLVYCIMIILRIEPILCADI